jgi:hypothetical protein
VTEQERRDEYRGDRERDSEHAAGVEPSRARRAQPASVDRLDAHVEGQLIG